MKCTFILGLICFLSTFCANAQNQYVVVFKDKIGSKFSTEKPNEFLSSRSIARRKTQGIQITNHDFPPNATYIDQVTNQGAKIRYKSKWLNAVLVECSKEVIDKIKTLNFVKEIEGKTDIKGKGLSNSGISLKNSENKFESISENFNYGGSKNQIEMIGIDKMHENGFTGKGVLIGILDSGFLNANKMTAFSKIFTENRVIDTYDFVDNEKSVYEDHSHGTNVMSCIGTNLTGELIGTAPDATFALFRTEDVFSETKIEEVYWLLGAEYADSLGVDIINSSLGYYSFDNPLQNYRYEDLNGNKTISARAADWAASKGIMVVVSAGNEGANSWGKISTPADADSILAVGAVNNLGSYVAFSSRGFRTDGKIKPEIAAKGQGTTLAYQNNSIGTGNGTSFSAPLISGAVACFKQAFPNLTTEELRLLIIKSGSQFATPNELLGYGIPNFYTAYELYKLEEALKNSGKEIVLYPNPLKKNENLNIYFNQKDSNLVNDIKLYDTNGKLVFETKKNGKLATLNFTNIFIVPGVYYVKISNLENQNFVSKIIIY